MYDDLHCHRRRSPDRRGILRTLSALALAAWLGPEAAAAGLRLVVLLREDGPVWRQAFEVPIEQRRRNTLDARDLEAGRARGYLNGVIDAVLLHVPEHETVYVAGLASREEAEAFVPMPYLCFPRRLERAARHSWNEREPLERSYLLTLGEELDARLAGCKRVLACGPGWKLWQ